MFTRGQDADRRVVSLLAAGVRCDDVYVDHGVSSAKASRPGFDRAVNALGEGDTLVVSTLDRLGRSTQNMLDLAESLRVKANAAPPSPLPLHPQTRRAEKPSGSSGPCWATASKPDSRGRRDRFSKPTNTSP